MEIPFACFQRLSLDQPQCSCSLSFSDHGASKGKPSFSRYRFRFNRPKWSKKFCKIRCFSLEVRGLRQRPRLKPVRIDGEIEGVRLRETQVKKSSVVISSRINKLVLCNRFREAISLFGSLELEGCSEVDSDMYDALISACIGLRSVRTVKRILSYMKNNGYEPDQYMRNRILLMHVKCGMIKDAYKLFDEMPEKNIVSWNTIFTGLVDAGAYLQAFRLFQDMWEEFSEAGPRTFAIMVRASAGLGLISVGRQLHSLALRLSFDTEIFISCALIDMYCKSGSIDDARWVFDDMQEKTTVGWNSIIAGYAHNGYSEEALTMYFEMRDLGVRMDHYTFSIIMRICERLAMLEHAKQAHAGLIRRGFGSDIVANTALVDFYCKWGRVEDARCVFDRMPSKNVLSWNALIAGYGYHGRGAEAVQVFEQMCERGVKPSHVTFLAVLGACSYSGLSEHGWEVFRSMVRDHNIKPRPMHLACMIELLGRQGQLDEALALIRDAPFKPTANMWAPLLTACRVQGNLELGKFAAEKLYEMRPVKITNYVVLLNIYHTSGELEKAASVLETLRRKGFRIPRACSWIDIGIQSPCFLSGESHHNHTEEIYNQVDKLMLKISKHGYVPGEKTLLPDADDKEARMLLYHSEKLAVAFGLKNSPDWRPLLVVQGHRICNDCHNAIKLIAVVTKRRIVVRDGSRFHHFRGGKCSCGDYW